VRGEGVLDGEDEGDGEGAGGAEPGVGAAAAAGDLAGGEDDGGGVEVAALAEERGVVVGGAEAREEVQAEGFELFAQAGEVEGVRGRQRATGKGQKEGETLTPALSHVRCASRPMRFLAHAGEGVGGAILPGSRVGPVRR
jgi:hypothetical protein